MVKKLPGRKCGNGHLGKVERGKPEVLGLR
jgi:hypothetical protein